LWLDCKLKKKCFVHKKREEKRRVNKNPLNFFSLVFIERSQNYEEAYQHNKHLAINCENLTKFISGV
jgi:hypothetical protein